MMRRVASAVAAVLMVGCGTAGADVPVASIPPDEAVTVYRIGQPKIDFLAEIGKMADVFDIPIDERPPEWEPWPPNDDGAAGTGGAGDNDGFSVSVYDDDGGPVSWLYHTPTWGEHGPFCDECPPMDDFDEADALARTDELMEALGQDFDGMVWDAEVITSGNGVGVDGYPEFDGAPVGDLNWTFVYGPGGELYFAAGYLIAVEPIGVMRRLPVDAVAAAVDVPYDESVPLEPTMMTVRDGNDYLVVPAYSVTLSNGTTITVNGADTSLGIQPLRRSPRPRVERRAVRATLARINWESSSPGRWSSTGEGRRTASRGPSGGRPRAVRVGDADDPRPRRLACREHRGPCPSSHRCHPKRHV